MLCNLIDKATWGVALITLATLGWVAWWTLSPCPPLSPADFSVLGRMPRQEIVLSGRYARRHHVHHHYYPR